MFRARTAGTAPAVDSPGQSYGRHGISSFRSARVALAVTWGLFAIVYLIVGGLIVRLLRSRH